MAIVNSEYDAFQRLTQSLGEAADAAMAVAEARPDQGYAWKKVAEALKISREACFRLAADGAVGKHHG